MGEKDIPDIRTIWKYVVGTVMICAAIFTFFYMRMLDLKNQEISILEKKYDLITLKKDVEILKSDLSVLTESLNHLFIQEMIVDPKQLDGNGNYKLEYQPIKNSTVVYTGPIVQYEGRNFVVDNQTVILAGWWKEKEPESFINKDHPIIIRYMRMVK